MALTEKEKQERKALSALGRREIALREKIKKAEAELVRVQTSRVQLELRRKRDRRYV
jgi:hypothetical protein